MKVGLWMMSLHGTLGLMMIALTIRKYFIVLVIMIFNIRQVLYLMGLTIGDINNLGSDLELHWTYADYPAVKFSQVVAPSTTIYCADSAQSDVFPNQQLMIAMVRIMG